VQAVVEAVFSGEELRGQGGHFAGEFTAGLGQAADFATGAKGFGAIAAQQYTHDIRVFGPGLQAFVQGQDHGQGQRVEGFFRVQAGDAEAGTVAAGQLFEVQVHRDLNRESEGSV